MFTGKEAEISVKSGILFHLDKRLSRYFNGNDTDTNFSTFGTNGKTEELICNF